MYSYLPNKNNYSDNFLNMLNILKEIIITSKENNDFDLSNLTEENLIILKKIKNINSKILEKTENIFYSLTSVNPDSFSYSNENLDFNNFPFNILISKAIFIDIELIEKYTKIINYLPSEKEKNEILSCIILKQNNISLYNYLLTKK